MYCVVSEWFSVLYSVTSHTEDEMFASSRKSTLTCAPRITEQGELSNPTAVRAIAGHEQQMQLIHSHDSSGRTVHIQRSLVRGAGVQHALLKVGRPLGLRCGFGGSDGNVTIKAICREE